MSKSKVIHFRKHGTVLSKIPLKIGNDVLNYVSEYKYLGVYFDEHLDFTRHSKIIAESATRALGALIAKYKNFILRWI